MESGQFVLGFPAASVAEANRYAADLAASLRSIHPDVSAAQQRERGDTQDLGATVVLVLGTASVTAVAHGIAAWLGRHSGAKIQVSTDGSVLASNLDSRDAARIAETFQKKK
jgi:hypothetical protein